jgi:dihydrofolate reductase
MSRISLIVAVASNGVIGRGNALPWHLPEDLAYFKRTTTGHTIIMGRKTLESIGRALPNRRNIVISGTLPTPPERVETAASLEAALVLCQADSEVFIIGGAKLYHAAIGLADRLLVTEIHRDVEGDVCFPAIPDHHFRESTRSHHQAASDPTLHFDFVVYQRDGDSVGDS